jgi:hypothetical protein
MIISWMCDPVLKAKSVTSTVVFRLEATWAMIPFTTDLHKKIYFFDKVALLLYSH